MFFFSYCLLTETSDNCCVTPGENNLYLILGLEILSRSVCGPEEPSDPSLPIQAVKPALALIVYLSGGGGVYSGLLPQEGRGCNAEAVEYKRKNILDLRKGWLFMIIHE